MRGVLHSLEVPSEIDSEEFEDPVDSLPAIRGSRRSRRLRPTEDHARLILRSDRHRPQPIRSSGGLGIPPS